MTDQPQWQGVTLYLVTTNMPREWASHVRIKQAAHEWGRVPTERDPHVWEVQIGQTPVDVTEEARKLLVARHV